MRNLNFWPGFISIMARIREDKELKDIIEASASKLLSGSMTLSSAISNALNKIQKVIKNEAW